MEITIEELNELLQKEFERGRNSNKKETLPNMTKLLIDSIPNPYIPEPCKNCSKHPSNGGDGVCHCILAVEPIYY